MARSKDVTLDGAVIRYDSDVLPSIVSGVFDAEYLQTNGLWLASTQGRSQAHFFRQGAHDLVLRHFHRGGLVGRMISDLFMRTTPQKSRPFLEYDLLADMHAKGLPVPRPAAARFVPAGLFYRADIITVRIPNARPLADVLEGTDLPAPVWRAVGAAIRALHTELIFHSDLNARNILIDAEHRVWIIDFDKCGERAAGPWMQGNLDRLKRSFLKFKTASPAFYWSQSNWDDLMLGYQSGSAS